MATIYVCRECKHGKDLVNALRRKTDATVKMVGCQDVCKQPVAGTRVGGTLEWLGGLDQPKRQRALVELMNDAPAKRLPDVLVKARSPKRKGKGPR